MAGVRHAPASAIGAHSSSDKRDTRSDPNADTTSTQRVDKSGSARVSPGPEADACKFGSLEVIHPTRNQLEGIGRKSCDRNVDMSRKASARKDHK